MKMWRIMLIPIAALAFSACSDDANTAATTAPPTTTQAPATTAPATTVPAVSDAELAQSALLTIDDMPTGWKESPVDDDDAEDARNMQRIAECSGLDANLIGDGVLGDSKAKSPEFDSPDELAATVKHTTGLATDEATATAAMAAIGDEKLAPCYEDAMRASFEEASTTSDSSATLPDGMTLTDIAMERTEPPFEIDADDTVWYSATATLDYQGQAIDIYLDLVFTRTGRVLSQIEFDGTGTRFPEDVFEPTITAAQTKINAIA